MMLNKFPGAQGKLPDAPYKMLKCMGCLAALRRKSVNVGIILTGDKPFVSCDIRFCAREPG